MLRNNKAAYFEYFYAIFRLNGSRPVAGRKFAASTTVQCVVAKISPGAVEEAQLELIFKNSVIVGDDVRSL